MALSYFGLAEDFVRWAFGDDYRDLAGDELIPRWNERHGKELYLSNDVGPKEALGMMLEVFEKSGANVS